MAKLIFADGTSKIVDYNTAAKMYQVLLGNLEHVGKELPKLKKLAEKTKDINFKVVK